MSLIKKLIMFLPVDANALLATMADTEMRTPAQQAAWIVTQRVRQWEAEQALDFDDHAVCSLCGLKPRAEQALGLDFDDYGHAGSTSAQEEQGLLGPPAVPKEGHAWLISQGSQPVEE